MPGFSGLDTLQASSVLRRLRDRGLLEKQGAGNRTHYLQVNYSGAKDMHPDQGQLLLEGGKQTSERGKPVHKNGKRDLPSLPLELAAKLPAPRQRMGEAALRQLIRDLCGWHTAGRRACHLARQRSKYLRNKHLSAMVQTGDLHFLTWSLPNHQLQAYKLKIEQVPIRPAGECCAAVISQPSRASRYPVSRSGCNYRTR